MLSMVYRRSAAHSIQFELFMDSGVVIRTYYLWNRDGSCGTLAAVDPIKNVYLNEANRGCGTRRPWSDAEYRTIGTMRDREID